nr:hypothetical protein [Tanacetum cinerariifolium]
MFERVRAFIRGEVAMGSVKMVWSSQWDKGNVRLAWFEGQEKGRNRNSQREGRRNMSIYAPYSRRDSLTPLIKTPKEILAMESKFLSQTRPFPLIRHFMAGLSIYHVDDLHTSPSLAPNFLIVLAALFYQDVEETLGKLQRVNVKIDLAKCSFGMEEGKFLGYVVAKEGIRSDPEKVQAILRNSTPRNTDQLHSLSLQLARINRFIPKLIELMQNIRNIQKKSDIRGGFMWTNEAEEAL